MHCEQKTLWTLVCLLAAGLMVAGCAGGSKAPPPLSAVTDSTAHSKARIRAIESGWDRVAADEIDSASFRESLKTVVWSRSTFWEIRLTALKELVRDAARIEDTKNMIRLMLPTETHWEVMEYVADLAIEREWRDLAPALVRSWSRPPVAEPPDERRPERRALAALFPDASVEATVYRVFAGDFADDQSDERERKAAWGLLCRIDRDGAHIRELLAQDDSATEDAMMRVLRRGAADLRSVPLTEAQLTWLIELARSEHSAFWSEAKAAIGGLSAEQLTGFELRHAAHVVWASRHRPGWLLMERSALLAELDRTLGDINRHNRVTSINAAIRQPPTLREWDDALVWGDVLSAMVGLEFVRSQEMHEALFYYADRDQLDASTEYGGIVTFADDARFQILEFPPRPAQRIADNRFVASYDMIEASDAALFHFHNHAQRYRNGRYAGPSDADIKYALREGRGCLLFTFVNRDTLNADYYQGDGANIDLGEITRPGAE